MSSTSRENTENQILLEWTDEFITRHPNPQATDKLRFIWEKMVNQEARLRELEARTASDFEGAEKEFKNV